MSDFDPLIASFGRSLRARNRSANTVRIYLGCAQTLAAWVATERGRSGWEQITRADVEDWLAARLERFSAGDAKNKFGSVQQMFKWLAAEDEIERNPMEGLEPPHVPPKPVEVLTVEQLRALFRGTKGRTMVARRDHAILWLFASTGMRLTELATIALAGLNLDRREVEVFGKGRKPRTVRFNHDTALALDRYLRSRDREKLAYRPELWLAVNNRGPLGREGVYQMLKRRGGEVGVPELYPHMLRHTYAHRWLDAGGAEGDLMEHMGWDSPQMLRRYGASARSQRARDAYDRTNIMHDL